MLRRELLIALGAALVIAGCGGSPTSPGTVEPPPSQNPPPPPPPAVVPPNLAITRILSFGDSMTAGTTSPALPSLGALTPGLPESYPYKLQALLSARYTAQTIAVANAGIPGEVVRAGRNRLAGAMSEARPELLILMEGANDLNTLNGAGLTDVSGVTAAMEDMVREASGRGAQVIVATLPPQRPGGKGNAGPLLAKYNNDLKTMASKKGAMLVDVNALLPLSLIGQDGLHPTEGGYQKLAEIFGDVIKGRWEVSAATASQQSAAHLRTSAIQSDARRMRVESAGRRVPR